MAAPGRPPLGANNLPPQEEGGTPRPHAERGSPGGSAGEFVDFSSAAARAERLALLEEALERYGVDGLELDCDLGGGLLFDPPADPAVAAANAALLTAFVAEVRSLVDATAARRGTPVGLGARVLPTLEGSSKMGLDVPTWLSAGLLDYVAPMFEQNEHLDPDLPFEETAALARQHGCFIYPAVRPFRTKEQGPVLGSAANYRAAAANYLRKGATALYLMQMCWPTCAIDDEARSLLGYLGDAELLWRRSRHFFVSPNDPAAAAYGYTSPLPAELSPPGGAATTFRLYIGDDLHAAKEMGLLRSVCLRLRLTSVSISDTIVVSIGREDGSEMAAVQPLGRTWDAVSYAYAWVSYPLLAEQPEALPRAGPNTVSVAITSRPHELGGVVQLMDCELLVEFVQQRNKVPHDLWPPLAGPGRL